MIKSVSIDDLIEEWDFEKNDKEGTPLLYLQNRVSVKTKVWWKCKNQNHTWEASIGNRLRGSKCIYCTNQRVLKGFNDMWAINPKLASLLLNEEDGYKYTESSNQKVDWICQDCSSVVKDKLIYNVNVRGVKCPVCSDGKSFPEKFVYSILRQSNLDFEWEKTFKWSEGKRYDFFVPSKNLIIEVHGEQHTKQQRRSGARTLEEEIENDIRKEILAKQNSVNYLFIDAIVPSFDYLKNSVEKSGLFEHLCFLVDWKKVREDSLKSLIKVSCDLWNSGLRSPLDISIKMKMNRRTILNYLKTGEKLSLCDYSERNARLYGNSHRKKPVLQLSKDGVLIREWSCASEAGKELKIEHIGSCCSGKRKTAGGFIWKFKE